MIDEARDAAWAVDTLLKCCPRYDGLYPTYSVVADFRRYVAERIESGAAPDEIREYFAWIEEVVSLEIGEFDDLLRIEFIDAAEWRLLGVEEYIGPNAVTLCDHYKERYARHAARGPSQPLHIADRVALHRGLIHRFPSFGDEADVLDGTLFSLADWLRDLLTAGDREAVARAFECIDKVVQEGDGEVGERVLEALFRYERWPVLAWQAVGSVVRERLAGEEWWPPESDWRIGPGQ
jgi:hypothetical protein